MAKTHVIAEWAHPTRALLKFSKLNNGTTALVWGWQGHVDSRSDLCAEVPVDGVFLRSWRRCREKEPWV